MWLLIVMSYKVVGDSKLQIAKVNSCYKFSLVYRVVQNAWNNFIYAFHLFSKLDYISREFKKRGTTFNMPMIKVC